MKKLLFIIPLLFAACSHCPKEQKYTEQEVRAAIEQAKQVKVYKLNPESLESVEDIAAVLDSMQIHMTVNHADKQAEENFKKVERYFELE